jgi:hypothetical protein
MVDEQRTVKDWGGNGMVLSGLYAETEEISNPV